MHGRTREGAHDRPDFVRGVVQRCWIDGDLIRLWTSPVGGIRPNGRQPPIPWLVDLSVLEEAMQSVYGRDFRLGDRMPILQMAVDALAAGDRAYAAELAEAVAFPPPDYFTTFRNACGRYLSWGPAHRRGNPRINVDAWRQRKALERKYDPNQPRVPRGHPNGGQWTDGSGDEVSDLDRPVTEEELSRADHALARLDDLVARSSRGLLHLAGGARDPFDPPKPPPTDLPPVEGTPKTRGQLVRQMITRIAPAAAFALRRSTWGLVASVLLEEGFPEVVTYFDEPKTLSEMHPRVRVEDYGSFDEFRRRNPAGPGYEWHHIREREFGSAEGWDVHSTDNIVRVPVVHHRRISDFYSFKREELGGMTVREWLKTKDPAFQREFGLTILKWRGVVR